MKTSLSQPRPRPVLTLAVLLFAFCCAVILAGSTQPSAANSSSSVAGVGSSTQKSAASEPADVSAFRASVGGDLTAVIVELKGEPGVLRKVAAGEKGQRMSVAQLGNYGVELYGKQDEFFSTLATRGVRALMRETDVTQIDGSVRHIEYRFTYLLNGFVAYVATEDLARLKALPEVTHVVEIQPVQFHLDKAIDYILGTQTNA